MRKRVWLAVLVAGAGMGTGGVSVRAALNRGVPPYALTLWRALIAAAAVSVGLALRRRLPSLDRRVWRVGVTMGIVNFGIPYTLWTLALRHASAGFVGLLSALVPLGTAVVAHLVLPDEPLRANRLAGLVLALAGVATLLGTGDTGLAEGGQAIAAGLLTITAVIMTAASGVYAKRHAGTYDPLEVSGIQFVVGAAVIALVTLVVEGVPGGVTLDTLGILAYCGLVTTALPSVLVFWLLRHVTATYAAVTSYLSPVVAVLAGALVLNERLGAGIAAGGTLILGGLVLTDRTEARGTQTRRHSATTAEPGG